MSKPQLIALRLCDVDITNRSATVLGKGNKYRTVYFGEKTTHALQNYLLTSEKNRLSPRWVNQAPVSPLFLSDRSRRKPVALTRSGLLQLLERLGAQCGITVSTSPHALRRTFAIQTLRNGANVFSVQAMLGHTNLQMTQKYCAIALTDVEAQHRQFGPLDRMASPDEMEAQLETRKTMQVALA